MIRIPKEVIYGYKAKKCRESFYYFLKTFWEVIIREQPIYNWHIEFLCNELQELSYYIVNRMSKEYDLIINIPPGTTKSTIVTIMYPVWLWTQDQTIRIITSSYSLDLSIDHTTKSRDILTSERFKKLFPNIRLRRDKMAKVSYENTQTGARYTTSTGSTITGKHAHIIINDDPLNPSQAASDTERNTANEHTKTLASRKVDKANTPTILIMQRLHENDVTGHILAKKQDKIKHICLPAEASSFVSPIYLEKKYVNGLLDPVRLSREILDEQKVDLGSRAYAGQYEQNPVVEGGNIIKRDWFQYISIRDFNAIYENEPIDFLVDTAFTDNKKNDPTGIIGVCCIKNNLYIHCGKKLYMQFPELIRFIPSYVKENGYRHNSVIRIEPKANGISVVQQLREMTGLNVKEIVSDLVRESKETRLTSGSAKIESGRVFLVKGNWNEEFIDEVTGFPNKIHDEFPDLLGYAIDIYLKRKTPIDLSRIARAAH
jgi:predicted phage terminase large subunit-like protein